MKKAGYVFIGLGLFFFGLVPVQIPIGCIVGGISAILLDKEIKL